MSPGCRSGPGCRWCSREYSTPRTRSGPRRAASARWSCPTTAGASSAGRGRASPRRPASARGGEGGWEAVDGRCEVLLDSGIRSGTDVLRALSLGAGGVLLGRPALWGLASGGARGAAQVLSLLADELTEAMTLAGCPDVGSARLGQATALAAELATAGAVGRGG